MAFVAAALTGLVALLHLGFLVLEMFLWTRPVGLKVFRQSPADAAVTATLAKNQGLYNGFLAAGLLWALLHPDASVGLQLREFFLGCVLVAAAYGAKTVSPRIFLVQGVPALAALGASVAAA